MRTVIESGLLFVDRGPWGAFGPTSGSWQAGDYLISKEFLEVMYGGSMPSAGWAAVAAKRNLVKERPEYRRLAMSYEYLGDPSIRLPHEAVTTTSATGGYRYALGAAHPNPSAGTMAFSFTMAKQGPASIRVYDVAGRLVRTLVDGSAEAGPHDIVWDASDNGGRRVGAGVYFYRMDAGSWRSQRKVVFLER